MSVLIALGIALGWYWSKTSSERSALKDLGANEQDGVVVEIALRALYRGLFLVSMFTILLLSVVRQLL